MAPSNPPPCSALLLAASRSARPTATATTAGTSSRPCVTHNLVRTAGSQRQIARPSDNIHAPSAAKGPANDKASIATDGRLVRMVPVDMCGRIRNAATAHQVAIASDAIAQIAWTTARAFIEIVRTL